MRHLAAWSAALCVVALAGCDDDDEKTGTVRTTGSAETSKQIPLSERLPARPGGFILDESSVETAPGSISAGALEAVIATYVAPDGTSFTLTFVEFENADQAAARLDAVVDMRLSEGWERSENDTPGQGQPVVLTKSAGVQARPNDVAYAWTTGPRFALAEGIGDAARDFYAAVDL